MKIGFSLFWRVLIIQIVFSLLGALLFAGSSISSDISLARYKPTIGQVSFAVVLWLSVFVSKDGLVHMAWGRRLGLGTPYWRSFTKMLAVVIFLLGCANLVAIHLLTIEQWMTFKNTIPLIVEIIFCLTVPRMLMAKLAA